MPRENWIPAVTGVMGIAEGALKGMLLKKQIEEQRKQEKLNQMLLEAQIQALQQQTQQAGATAGREAERFDWAREEQEATSKQRAAIEALRGRAVGGEELTPGQMAVMTGRPWQAPEGETEAERALLEARAERERATAAWIGREKPVAGRVPKRPFDTIMTKMAQDENDLIQKEWFHDLDESEQLAAILDGRFASYIAGRQVDPEGAETFRQQQVEDIQAWLEEAREAGEEEIVMTYEKYLRMFGIELPSEAPEPEAPGWLERLGGITGRFRRGFQEGLGPPEREF